MKLWLALALWVGGFVVSDLCAHKVSELFAVKRVTEFAKADSAAQAQEMAKSSAMQRAFGVLLKRLAVSAYKDLEIDRDKLEALVLSYSVEDERMSGKNYKASFSFQFDPTATKEFLQNSGVSLVERTAPRVLLIPVLRKAQDTFIWQENPWFGKWKASKPFTAVQPYTLPKQDLFDASTWPVTQYPLLSQSAAAALCAQYRVSGIVLSEATLSATGALQLRLLHYNKEGTLKSQESAEFGVEKLDTLLGQAVEQTQVFLENIGKRNNGTVSDSAKIIEVRVPVKDVHASKEIMKALHNIEGIQRIMERELRSYEIVLGIVFRTSLEDLQDSLRDHGFELRKRGDQVFLRENVKPQDPEPTKGEVEELQASLSSADAE